MFMDWKDYYSTIHTTQGNPHIQGKSSKSQEHFFVKKKKHKQKKSWNTHKITKDTKQPKEL